MVFNVAQMAQCAQTPDKASTGGRRYADLVLIVGLKAVKGMLCPMSPFLAPPTHRTPTVKLQQLYDVRSSNNPKATKTRTCWVTNLKN